MKSLIILILLIALISLAHFTRPSEQSFRTALLQQAQAQAATAATSPSAAQPDPDTLFKDITYRDRFLWADIQKDGQTLYTGAFGHWFEHGKVLEAPAEKTNVKLPV